MFSWLKLASYPGGMKRLGELYSMVGFTPALVVIMFGKL